MNHSSIQAGTSAGEAAACRAFTIVPSITSHQHHHHTPVRSGPPAHCRRPAAPLLAEPALHRHWPTSALHTGYIADVTIAKSDVTHLLSGTFRPRRMFQKGT